MPHATINGARLWYDVQGSGQPILLHHGYTASRVNWAPVAQRLSERYRVILMEGRGTGASEHTEDGYSLEQYADDVTGMLDYLGEDTVTYAGHSMGGGIGYLLALNAPERLQRLILMAPIPADGVGEITPEMREARMRERAAGDREALLHRYRAMRFRADVETDAWFEDRVDHILGVSEGHFVGSAESMSALNVLNRLQDITLPTLMIAAGVDSLLIANLRDFMALPNATLEVLSRAGHEVAVHEPDRVAACIEQFMIHGVVTADSLMARLEAANA